MKIVLRLILFTWICMVTVYSCSKAKEDTPGVKDPCADLSPSYSNDISPILTLYCTNKEYGTCHAKGSETDLTSYTVLKSKVDGGHITEHVVNKREMPPLYSKGPLHLNETEINKIKCWIAHGAMNN